MNALQNFYRSGAAAADHRVADALAPPSLEAADRYLKSSAIVTAIDRATLRLQQWWLASEAWRWCASITDAWQIEPMSRRRQAVAMIVLMAVVVHVMLTLLQGAHYGWFWMIIPALAALYAVVVLAGLRASGAAK